MALRELGIEKKRLDEALVATVRVNLKNRGELPTLLSELSRHIPREYIVGPPFCIIQFITSIKEGFDAEVGFPVSRAVEGDTIGSRVFPALEVLSLVHKGPVEKLPESYRLLYGSAAERGLISDEFSREVYPEWNNPEGGEIELQFVLHNWNGLLGKNLERVLGEAARREIMQGSDALTVESTVDERFLWAKGAIGRLDGLADEGQTYDIVSSCAHVFPRGQVDKLKAVYENARARADDPMDAVDAVIEFMAEDPGWGERPLREGNVIYASKAPRDGRGYEKAKDETERRRAYCFCPVLRNHLDEGMPLTFCYCGAGWYRQQWEGAIGKPVEIEIVKSVLRGDNVCQFAIRLPDDL